MKERRSLVFRSKSLIYLSELTMRLIDQIQSAFLGHIHWRGFSRARAATLPTIAEEVEPYIEQIQPLPPVGTDIRRITVVQESTVNEKTWHIACVPKTFAKAC